ncbi:MAG TPA: hypothetical protein VHN15_02650 [Thermoanaerobaculia bacterium]|nr:hypothetical protein [Thermoanaerobaculia bacterium]
MLLIIRKYSSALLYLPFILFIALVGILSAATPSGAPPALRISSEITLPTPALERARDVRWAGDNSVYLGLGIDGAVEVKLDPAHLAPREMIQGSSKPGGFWGVERIAASSMFFVAAGPALSLTWRRLDDPARVEHAFEGIQAIDVRGNRLAILGVMRDEQREVGKDGAIAWAGSLDKNLEDLRPFLYDISGRGARAMGRCILNYVGAVRFLKDGGLAVLPGVQPGVHLYDPEGRLVRTWDTASLGIDADCGSLSEEQYVRLMGRSAERQAWVNRRQTVDTLLPLDQGLGVVVRRVQSGRTRWGLKLLRRDGSSATYAIPIEGSNEFFHLKGDARSGRVVFLLYREKSGDSIEKNPAPPRIFVAQLPADQGWVP